jgi:hypothetical protein
LTNHMNIRAHEEMQALDDASVHLSRQSHKKALYMTEKIELQNVDEVRIVSPTGQSDVGAFLPIETSAVGHREPS